jgi:hypothetical protein
VSGELREMFTCGVVYTVDGLFWTIMAAMCGMWWAETVDTGLCAVGAGFSHTGRQAAHVRQVVICGGKSHSINEIC